MSETACTKDAEEYVFYHASDYAGFFRRIVAIVVDLVALLAILLACNLSLDLIGAISLDEDNLQGWYVVSIIIVGYPYLTLLKRSRLRTPGYWLAGLRIVDLKGRPPSMFLMTLRLFWWVLGPINPLIDLLFMTSDDRRQTIRDKLIGTYVIKKNAAPAGFGHKTIGSRSFMGMMLMYPVVRPTSSSGSEGN